MKKTYNCKAGPFDQVLFRELTAVEEAQFQQHAKDNDPSTDPDKWYISHPACREVWEARGFVPPEIKEAA